ncbi:MAG: M20/M25/M40 family metallo-hydrolase [Pyrinomonadaceae bacterium]
MNVKRDLLGRQALSTAIVMLLVAAMTQGLGTPASAQMDEVSQINENIRKEVRAHSQIMNYAFYLSDVYGPRLTGSPNYRRAAEWAIGQMKQVGLTNIAKDKIDDFRYSWTNTRFFLAMTEPSFAALIGAPMAWSTGTSGPVEGDAIRIDFPEQKLSQVTEFIEKSKGKLRGKVLFLNGPSVIKSRKSPQSVRWTDAEIEDQASKAEARLKNPQPTRPQRPPRNMKEIDKVNSMLGMFFRDEGVVALTVDFDSAMKYGGTFLVQNAMLQGPRSVRRGFPPVFAMAAEHYNRVLRLIDKGIRVRLKLDVGTTLIENPIDAYNIIAELPGRDRADEVVMVGAHLDSWTGGTGATDNAAGCAVVMEVARILKTLNLHLSRTVRFVLWGGEENGNHGSFSYVNKHLVSISRDPTHPWDLHIGTTKPEFEKFSSYYNLDEGTGRIRAVIIGNDVAARPLIESWLAPVRDLGVIAVIPRGSAGSDDATFASVGLPSFSFVQDPLDYDTTTHHTNMDVYDHLQEDDLKQAAIVLTTLVYADANRTARMPRPPRNQ